MSDFHTVEYYDEDDGEWYKAEILDTGETGISFYHNRNCMSFFIDLTPIHEIDSALSDTNQFSLTPSPYSAGLLDTFEGFLAPGVPKYDVRPCEVWATTGLMVSPNHFTKHDMVGINCSSNSTEMEFYYTREQRMTSILFPDIFFGG